MRHFFTILCVLPALAQTPDTRINPTVKQIVDAISEQRMETTLRKLEGFGTRYVLFAQDEPEHGIGAAKRWIHDELKSYSPRLEVSYQDFTIKKGARQGQIIRESSFQMLSPCFRKRFTRGESWTARFRGHGSRFCRQ